MAKKKIYIPTISEFQETINKIVPIDKSIELITSFKINDDYFAFELNDISHISILNNYEKIFFSNEYTIGLSNYENTFYTIIDFDLFINKSNSEDFRTNNFENYKNNGDKLLYINNSQLSIIVDNVNVIKIKLNGEFEKSDTPIDFKYNFVKKIIRDNKFHRTYFIIDKNVLFTQLNLIQNTGN